MRKQIPSLIVNYLFSILNSLSQDGFETQTPLVHLQGFKNEASSRRVESDERSVLKAT